ncbi:unnamed protein product [Spirodela intermedia]|uniref:Uncharacterized protein n=1 Tax=Spirodela intermedia TaxID=51605 RepID=A0A7I8KEC7_SPIIN|nr:unnamed protein product [Spirodela intermedia]
MILGTRWLASVWGEGHIPMAMQSFLLLMNFTLHNTGIVKASSSRISPSNDDDGILSDIFDDGEVETNNRGTSFLSKLAIALGIAATITLLSVCFKGPNFGSSLRFPFSFDGSSPLISSGSPVGYTLSIFGCQVVLPEYTPGWIYFWLLMAAGCGIFISEEALNVWVGISLARSLSLDGTWNTFMISFSKNAPYIVSTVLWVYWGVCISDMIPFYLGRLFRQTKASVDICSKLGIGKDKVVSITRVVQKYGNMIGFVERFSVGARNPTSFLAGAWGIPSDCFFAGVCCGGLITLPVQLGIGFLLRERPAVALAGVATVVGMWTLLPYAIAASAALFMFLRQRLSS